MHFEATEKDNIFIIQTALQAHRRFIHQLITKKVDTGQYIDCEDMVNAWDNLNTSTHYCFDFFSIPFEENLCVIDLGPGTGSPCLEIIKYLNIKISQLVLIDVSLNMLKKAIKNIQNSLSLNIPLYGIVADFLKDTNKFMNLLPAEFQKLFLCLGCTLGNFSQPEVFTMFNQLMSKNDYLLVEIGTYEDQAVMNYLVEEANFYTSMSNCYFGLHWLIECRAAIDYNATFANIERDINVSDVWLIKGFYKFPSSTILKIKNKSILFAQDEVIQYVETRRYPKNRLCSYFKQYGYNIISISNNFSRALLLLKKF